MAGSPKKAENLTILKRKKPENFDDDPRPQKFRNMEGYADRFRNIIINYEAETNHNMAMRYLFPTADLQQAVHDHTYTSLPFTEHWVERNVEVSIKCKFQMVISNLFISGYYKHMTYKYVDAVL